jgi:hypothetical protein
MNGIESLSRGIGFDTNAGNRALNAAEELVGNPKTMVQNFANYGIGELRSMASEQLVRPLVGRYLANGNISGDEYLKSVRVVNFNFGDCIIIDRNGNIKLSVDYEIEYTFGALRLPFGPTLKVSQTVVTKALLGGSGVGYW